MPILRISRRRVGRDAYEAAHADLDLDRLHPLGLIMHGAMEVEGEMQVVQVWESAEYAARFNDDYLTPTLLRLGIPLESKVTVFELEYLVTP